jgi:hypothetical protein
VGAIVLQPTLRGSAVLRRSSETIGVPILKKYR